MENKFDNQMETGLACAVAEVVNPEPKPLLEIVM